MSAHLTIWTTHICYQFLTYHLWLIEIHATVIAGWLSKGIHCFGVVHSTSIIHFTFIVFANTVMHRYENFNSKPGLTSKYFFPLYFTTTFLWCQTPSTTYNPSEVVSQIKVLVKSPYLSSTLVCIILVKHCHHNVGYRCYISQQYPHQNSDHTACKWWSPLQQNDANSNCSSNTPFSWQNCAVHCADCRMFSGSHVENIQAYTALLYTEN